MISTNIEPLFPQYQSWLASNGLEDELYKWRAIKHFQDNWDPDAKDFGSMFLKAISKHNNLIDRWCIPFIEESAKFAGEDLKQLLTALYDESVEVENRIVDFAEQAKALSVTLTQHPEHDDRKTLKQDERTTSVYLAFRYPEKYTLYKSSYYTKLCSLLELKEEKAGQKLIHFYQLAYQVRTLLLDRHQDLIKTVHALRTSDCYQGDDTALIVQDLMFQTLNQGPTTIQPSATSQSRRYWLIAPGEGASLWQNAIEDGVIRIGWDALGDLTQYDSQKSIAQALNSSYGGNGSRKNDSLACWDFCNSMQNGDIIVAKQGMNKLLGWGEVIGEYKFQESYDTFKSVHKVNWLKTGDWNADNIPIPIKTVTDWTSFPGHIENIRKTVWDEENVEQQNSILDLPLNLILYGPPGTGKTYKLQNEFFPKFTEAETNQTQSEFEESIVTPKSWWEIISATMLDLKTAKVGEILDHPLVQAKIHLSSNNNPRAAIWAQLQIHTKTDCPNVNYTKRIEPQVFFKDENSLWSIDVELAKELIPQASELLETWKNGPSRAEQKKRYVFTTFHQSYSYEDFIEGIKPVMADAEGELTYEIKEGVFKSIARQAERNPDKPHAIFIDEINRGNIAAIFGELITLIEDDKRLGAESELAAILPYSRETFSVPPNLYIIGTMNTADRSVEALDTALRRRFSFQQMLPAPEKIENSPIEGIDLTRMLHTINNRIERLLDKDHTIGHAFFMSCRTVDDLKKVFANKILPLLEEFFYNDTAKIGMILGDRFVSIQSNNTKFAKGNWDNGDFDDRETYKLENIATLGPTDFISIYDV